MTLHAASFCIYILITIISVIAVGLNSYGLVSWDFYLMTDFLTILCSSVTQAMICYIFWNLENIQEPVTEADDDLPRVEEVDTQPDIQMRLWYQFMRDPNDSLSSFRSVVRQNNLLANTT